MTKLSWISESHPKCTIIKIWIRPNHPSLLCRIFANQFLAHFIDQSIIISDKTKIEYFHQIIIYRRDKLEANNLYRSSTAIKLMSTWHKKICVSQNKGIVIAKYQQKLLSHNKHVTDFKGKSYLQFKLKAKKLSLIDDSSRFLAKSVSHSTTLEKPSLRHSSRLRCSRDLLLNSQVFSLSLDWAVSIIKKILVSELSRFNVEDKLTS